MGSSGTGNFTDYPPSGGGRTSGKGGGGGSAGGGGKSGDKDKCERDIDNLPLEDVANCEYFKQHKTVPPLKTKVKVRKKLVGGRIAVETASNGEVVGYVPTAYNYLRGCMERDWEYSGKVADSASGKLPKIKVDLAASK